MSQHIHVRTGKTMIVCGKNCFHNKDKKWIPPRTSKDKKMKKLQDENCKLRLQLIMIERLKH